MKKTLINFSFLLHLAFPYLVTQLKGTPYDILSLVPLWVLVVLYVLGGVLTLNLLLQQRPGFQDKSKRYITIALFYGVGFAAGYLLTFNR